MEQLEDRVDTNPEDKPTFRGKTSEQWHKYWQYELQAEDKRNREWRRRASEIQRRYLDERHEGMSPQYLTGTADFRINLFHSNTFTLMAFMYGRVPKVDCSRRFSDAKDDVGRMAANVFERLLNTSIESDEEDFTSVMRGNLEDWLVPGIGIAKVRYEFEEKTVEHEAEMVATPTGAMVEIEAYTEKELLWEEAAVDYVHWRDFRWGYGRRWKDLPWVSYDVYLDRQDAEARFGKEVARKLTYEKKGPNTDDKNKTESADMSDPQAKALVTEIWSKKYNSVFWFHDKYDGILDMKEDPLGLEGFFPSPKPLIANNSTTLFQPQPFFMLAQDLYNEVDQLSTRINIITNAVKVVGVYDKTHGEIKTMLQGSLENDLVPVDNYAMLGEKGGLKGVIDFWPVEDIVNTLDKLREMRREAIDLLYQVTGISDILRGMSEQYTGVGTQKLKAQFGSVRVQYLQEEFSRFGSDLLTLRAEIISKHFDEETIVKQSNILRSFDGENQQLGEAVALIKNFDEIKWRAEIKPESMAMIDWTQMKIDRTEFLNALATYLQSAQPIMQTVPNSTPYLLKLLQWGLSGFKGGQEIEGVLDQAIQDAIDNPPQQEGEGDDTGGKLALENAKTQGKLQINQQKFQQDMAKQADKAQKEMEKMLTQFRQELQRIYAETQSDAIKEVVQADQNIREKKATEKRTIQ